MDCRTARLLLRFNPSGAAGLEAHEAEALRVHLANCPDCSAALPGERALDQKLGRAMLEVAVPAGLRDRLLARLAAERAELARLAAERGAWYRRLSGLVLRYGSAAAAVLLLACAVWMFYPLSRPPLETAALFDQVNIVREGPDELTRSWERLGVAAVAPDDFNYNYLTGHGIAELPAHPGKKVAVLEFAHTEQRVGVGEPVCISNRARVYVVSDRQFDLKGLTDKLELSDGGYPYRLQVRIFKEVPHYVYLIVHTGESPNWFILPKVSSEG